MNYEKAVQRFDMLIFNSSALYSGDMCDVCECMTWVQLKRKINRYFLEMG